MERERYIYIYICIYVYLFADPWGLDRRVTFIDPSVASLLWTQNLYSDLHHFDPGRPRLDSHRHRSHPIG